MEHFTDIVYLMLAYSEWFSASSANPCKVSVGEMQIMVSVETQASKSEYT